MIGIMLDAARRRVAPRRVPSDREWTVNEPDNQSRAVAQGVKPERRSRVRLWIAAGTAMALLATRGLADLYRQSEAAASVGPAAPAPLPQVVVSRPLVREVGSRLSFLGQFSAVEQVELRAQ